MNPNRLRNLMNMVAHTPTHHSASPNHLRSLVLLLLTIITPWGSPLLAQNDAAAQQAVIEIVRLQHRDPSQIRAAITPYLDERGAISQIDNNLIISTSRANLAQLEERIAELDIPRRQLRISVDFDYGRAPAPRIVDDASIATTVTTANPEDTVQSIVIAEGDFALFNPVSDTPIGGLGFAELAALLEQQGGNSSVRSISLTAQPRGTGAVLEIAALRSEPDLNGSSQTRVASSTMDVALNQWQVIAPTDPIAAPGSAIDSAIAAQATAVRVELLP